MTNLTRIDLGDGAYECVSALVLEYRDIKPVEPFVRPEHHMNSKALQARRLAVHDALRQEVGGSHE